MNGILSGQRHQTTFGLDLTFKKQVVPYLTAKPASLRAFAVPPEAIRFKPTEAKFLANSTRPVLSETLNKAETKDISHHSQYKCFKAQGVQGRRSGLERAVANLTVPTTQDFGPGSGPPPASRTRARGPGPCRPQRRPSPSQGPTAPIRPPPSPG